MTEPTTVTEFLNKHGLPYAAAFEENGHDHLPSLLEASEEDLATVISDVKMLSGHAMRLRKILGKVPPTSSVLRLRDIRVRHAAGVLSAAASGRAARVGATI